MQFVNIIELTIHRREKNNVFKQIKCKKINFYKFYNLLRTNKSIVLLCCHQYYQVVQFQRLYL